jgi:arylsulfatase A-like enzyme
VDLLGVVRGTQKDPPHPALYWRLGEQIAIRAGRWKLLRLRSSEPFRLYDLETDARESKDLAAAQPHRARNLQDRLMAWKRELVPPRW